MSVERRFSLLGIIAGLMTADNLGDVADEINHLHDLAGVPRPEGNFVEGWTDQDWMNIGKVPDENVYGAWVSYYPDYSEVTWHRTESDARRAAVRDKSEVIFLPYGVDLRDHVRTVREGGRS